MRVYNQSRFSGTVLHLLNDFVFEAEKVDGGRWQSLDVKGDPNKVTWELREASLVIRMPDLIEGAQQEFRPNLPWAEDHFRERVSGIPHNPPPSQAWWPFVQNGHSEHLNEGKFSHTYPERFWPKHAGHGSCNCPLAAEMVDDTPYDWPCDYGARNGVRFEYGDLRDVVDRLVTNPLTRQAYLPVWFPEDTGAPASERVPCTLGYLFMIRNGKLHVTYHIRSCDFMRHFRDDVYMAVRLGQWVRDQLEQSRATGGEVQEQLEMGELTMHIGSFHIFAGDTAMVKYLLRQATLESNQELLRKLG